ncbi:MAG: VWA domain-containing protein [Gammaproteobacteria bacterium]|nr:VWA domain-containing protein [Gammaproteobacteria bacterium]
MIDLEWPWVLIFLPLPLLIRYWFTSAPPRQETELKVPFIDDFQTSGYQDNPETGRPWHLILATLAWILLVVAAARPQWLGEPVEIPLSGRDLMLAIDLSGSMEEQDFLLEGEVINRLTATKQVAGDFIERRIGDRIGLILFGERAYLQAPLTLDRKTVRTLLDEGQIGLAGQKTAIGDAIGLGVKRLGGEHVENRVLILLTDGANTAGEVAPLQAAELAARKGLRIHTIGIGADRMTVQSLFGRRTVNPSRDLDETTLKKIAETTGGRYFRARNTTELDRIYQLLDELEPIQREVERFRPVKPLYPWLLGLSLGLAALVLLVPRDGGLQR